MLTEADHPLDVLETERSRARLADYSLGLKSIDAGYWRAKAFDRLAFLEEDLEVYGLALHELLELTELKALLAGVADVAPRAPAKGPPTWPLVLCGVLCAVPWLALGWTFVR